MKNQKKSEKLISFLLPIITVICLIVIWWCFSLGVNNEFVLPDPEKSVIAMGKLLSSGEFYVSLAFTLLRSFLAFFISFITAFGLVLLSQKNQGVKNVIKTLISITRALPTIAVVLLLLLWTNSFLAPIIVTVLVVLPTVYTNIENSIYSVDNDAVNMCVFYGVSKSDIRKKVIIPEIMLSLLSSIGSGLSLNLKLMVAAEVLSQTANSIGYLLNTSKVYFETSKMIALVIFTVIIGVIIESVFSILSKKAGKWI